MPTRPKSLCRALAEKIRAEIAGPIDFVVGPAIGGIIPAYETSRHLGVPAVWVEREAGEFRLRRFEMPQGARVVIVEDIVTTGLSIKETISCLQKIGADVDRRSLHRRSLCRQDPSWRAACFAGPIRSAGLFARPAAAGTGSDPAGQAREPQSVISVSAATSSTSGASRNRSTNLAIRLSSASLPRSSGQSRTGSKCEPRHMPSGSQPRRPVPRR
jgi:hypothetical protein